jgi:hypothetical protein
MLFKCRDYRVMFVVNGVFQKSRLFTLDKQSLSFLKIA